MKKILLIFCAIILAGTGFAQHTLVLNPVSDCYVETYGGGVGKNSFLKFNITSLPSGAVLTATKLRTFVSNISLAWDGDLGIIHYSNQTWVEGDSTKFLWQLIYLADTLTQLSGFGTAPGWAETIDIKSFLNVDFQTSKTYFSLLLKDLDDPTFAPNMSGISINDNDSMMIGNIFNDNIVFRPREWVNSPPELVIDYGIPPTVQPVLPVSPVCEGSPVSFSISATGDAPLSYQWKLNGVDITGANTNTYSLISAQLTDAGNYTCVVTNAYGSDVSGVINLVINANPTITVSGTSVSCNGTCDGTATALVSGGSFPYTLFWSNGAMGATITNLCPGIYSPTVMDSNGCTAADSITITEPTAISVSVSQTNVNCYENCDGSIYLTYSGGTSPYNILWSTGAIGNFITGLCAGTYCYTITDANNCTVTGCVTIMQPTQLNLTTTQTNVTCNGNCDGTATVNASGGTPGYVCIWSANTGGQTTATATNLCAGTYSVTVSDSNACSATISVTITEPAALSVSVSQTNVTCNGLCDGTATLSVSGGTAPYSYGWSNGLTTPIGINLCAGTYDITITDANNCTATASITITEPAPLVVSVSQTNVTCNGLCDGTASVSVIGGTPGYSFIWCTGQITNIATNLCAGTCGVSVTDVNMCIASASFIITEPVVLTTSFISNTQVSCGGACTGSLTVNASGGSGGYLYSWSPNVIETTQYADNLCAGIYDVTVTDLNGCTSFSSAEVTDTSNLQFIIVNSVNPTCYGYCDGSATVSAVGGVPPYSFIWNTVPAQTLPDAVNLCNGIYSVTVTDDSLCSRQLNVIINEPVLMTSAVTSTDDYGIGDGTATVVVSGGTLPYTYLWDDPLAQITSTATNLVAGLYHVTVTSANGCTITDSVEVILWTGVTSQKINFNYTLYPNPVKNEINLKITTNKTENISITIYNSMGNMIVNKEISLIRGDNLQNFDLQQIASGVYFIKLQRLNSASYLKFIKTE